jgi:hypothetical protein
MRITGIGGESSVRLGVRSHQPPCAPEKADAPVSGRSLVPVEPVVAATPPSLRRPRPSAAFLAQVIATSLGLAQTREKRRASMGEATAVYGARGAGKDGHRALSASA